jgi:large subunit ribosomal protein L9
VLATRGSLKQAESSAGVYARRASKVLTEAQQAAAALEGKTITIRARVGSENRLYGSVTAADLATALQSQYQIAIDRRKIELDEAIHRTGTYSATADLGQGVSARFSVEVAPEVAGAHGKASVVASAPATEPAPAQASTEEPEAATDSDETDETDETDDTDDTDDITEAQAE